MANVFGQRLSAGVHSPGAYLGGAPKKTRQNRNDREDEDTPVDSVAKWAQKMEILLKREKETVTAAMRRNWSLATGDGHWSRNRPKWKVRTTINYCFWVPTQWAAILTDNKPRVSFGTLRREDQRQADILNAAWSDCFDRSNVARAVHDAVYMSRVERKAFVRMAFDPLLDDGEGRITFEAVSGTQVYVNDGATTINDADVVMYEYEESLGTVLQRYPHITDKLRTFAQKQANDADEDDQILSPATSFAAGGTTHRTSQYFAESNPPVNEPSSKGIPMREFWTRPRGPRYMTTVETLMFEVNGKPTAIPKTIEYEDGSAEFLKTVITEGGVVYEWPESVVEEMKAAQALGGIKILDVFDAVEVFTEEVEVPLYPTGRRVVMAGNIRADDGMNPFSHGQINLIEINAYRNPRSMWGTSDVDLIADLNNYVNRLYSLLLDAAMLTSNPIWRIPMSSDISDDDITNAPGSIQREDQMMLKAGKREQGPEMPQYVMSALQFGIERIREISGLSEIATGGKFKGQQAAETVSMYQEAAGVRFRDALHDLEAAFTQMGTQFMGLVGQFYTSPKMVKIKSEAGIDEPVSFLGTDLSAPMFVKASAGSAMPQSPSARLQFMMQLLNSPKPIVDLPEVWSLLQEVGLIDSATALEKRIHKEMNSPTEQWKVMPPPGAKPAPKGKQPGSTRSRSARS